MADLKKLAAGRAGIKQAAKATPPSVGKPQETLEQSCCEEVGEIAKAFRDRIGKEDGRRRAAVDSEFWFAVCFASREEKERFLRKYRLDKAGDKYLDGRAVARLLWRRMGLAAGGARDKRG